MFYLCFKFLNDCSILTLDKPNSAWKFLRRGFLVAFMDRHGPQTGPSRPGWVVTPEARGPVYLTSILVESFDLLVVVPGLQLKRLAECR